MYCYVCVCTYMSDIYTTYIIHKVWVCLFVCFYLSYAFRERGAGHFGWTSWSASPSIYLLSCRAGIVGMLHYTRGL